MSRQEDQTKIDFKAIKSSYDNYIVRPINAFGIAGFEFSVPRETTITLKAAITDHYVEDNQAVQDHIAIKPASVVLTGFVGELVDEAGAKQSVVSEVARKLTTLSAYIPTLEAAASQTKALLAGEQLSLENITGTASDLWNLTKSLNPNSTAIEQAYLYFKAVFEQKIFVGLETPFEFFPNMAVEQIIAIEPEDSNTIADFSITLKQIRVAQTQLVDFEKENYQERTAQQAEPVKEQGKAIGEQKSLALQLTELINPLRSA